MRCSALLALVLSAACGRPGTCSRHSDCATGEKCSAAGTCVGLPDAGMPHPDAAVDAANDAAIDGGP